MKTIIQTIVNAQLAIILLAGTVFATCARAQEMTHLTATMTVKAPDPDKACDTLTGEAQKVGGYFTEKSLDSITLKAPSAYAQDLMDIASGQGQVIERVINRQDLREKLLKKKAALKAKENVRSQYENLLKQADIESLIYVEKALIELAAEIETLKAAIRLLEHRGQYAQIRVHFKYPDRSPPVHDGKSLFEWLNTMNLIDLLKDF
ncbi:MAG: DUF4349 domain-containing protein [Desulfobacteraceae bacterium]|nr:DUF4349 domain-containing protein [Desulfobacteraceae bacterium]